MTHDELELPQHEFELKRAAIVYQDTNYHDTVKWAMRSANERCRIVASVRNLLAKHADRLIALNRNPQRTNDIETVASELIPLADALQWIGRRGPKTLRDRRVGISGRPIWMLGVHSVVQRVPLGRVLILGTWNYPIFLSGVQIAQGLAAGNVVSIKPAPGSEEVTAALVDLFHQAGIPPESLCMLDSSPEAAIAAINGTDFTNTGDATTKDTTTKDTTTDVNTTRDSNHPQNTAADLVVLTGAASTGRKVLRQTAEKLTPTIMELSGVDGVVVMPGADWKRVTAALRFGFPLNSGATCIGPRRLMFETNEASGVPKELAEWIESLRDTAAVEVHPAARRGVADTISQAIQAGAVDEVGKFNANEIRESGRMFPVVLSNVPDHHPVLQSDLFAPVISLMPLSEIQTAISIINRSPYRLAASVFGPPQAADTLARQLQVGSVTVNDLIAPTADPRLPFGGRGESGFGVTRGPEGLLAMTAIRVIATRSGRIAPHLSPRKDTDADLLTGTLQWKHTRGLRNRLAAIRRLTTAAVTGKPIK
ncbi:aldehyde dehydrogenase (NAD+) [Neorhodopirellula lusitana]|uniref:Aldehyde dehydrogenase (NAD+) n=2 Tax=Neorhodopirellula lusitana TaxID=445327 RepID=A0ABY1PTU5_9BACT|nr:aldehyde dehydrogenase (NAD+) [Neorhodopirellula lusitana]